MRGGFEHVTTVTVYVSTRTGDLGVHVRPGTKETASTVKVLSNVVT